MKDYSWLEKRSLRSIDNLKLWADNPRIDPDEKHRTIKDYADDLIQDNGEKDSFIKLMTSIARDGFIPADPIVVWKDGNNYFVAEGNRRILALKLLRAPEKAPKSIRYRVRTLSTQSDFTAISKVRVSVAPSFEACEWYINQRHFSNSLQRPWSRLQQQRWIAELYDKYDKDITKVCEITSLSVSDISSVLRILKIRDLALDPVVMNQLDEKERESVLSHRIPMTILERFFINSVVKEKWGYDFNDNDLVITSNRESFLNAYAYFLKLVIQRDEDDVEIKVNTRTITDNLESILETIPEVSFEKGVEAEASNGNEAQQVEVDQDKSLANQSEGQGDQPEPPKPQKSMAKDLNRKKLIPKEHHLNSGNHKLEALFNELKRLPFNSYRNVAAASLRVFLDLAVWEYINSEGLDNDMCAKYKCSFQDIPLRRRLDYLKENTFTARSKEIKVLEKLLNPTNEHSLDTLNSYIHGSDTHKVEKVFLNGFWDFLFPLFVKILDMEEK